MIQLKLNHNEMKENNIGSTNAGCINYQQMKNQYDLLFRNFQQSQTTRMMISQCEESPMARYFSVRIEFNSQQNQCSSSATNNSSLPLAINPDTTMNSLFVTAQKDGRNKFSVYEGPNQSIVPSIINSIDAQQSTSIPLGSIFENNVTGGLGVKLVSYQHDHEMDNEIETVINTQNCLEKTHNVVVSTGKNGHDGSCRFQTTGLYVVLSVKKRKLSNKIS